MARRVSDASCLTWYIATGLSADAHMDPASIYPDIGKSCRAILDALTSMTTRTVLARGWHRVGSAEEHLSLRVEVTSIKASVQGIAVLCKGVSKNGASVRDRKTDQIKLNFFA